MLGKKAQTDVMSVVIITGIIISLVGAAYFWGKPLIEKRATIAEFTSIENFILELNDKIVDIANSGSGKHTLELPLGSISAVAYNPLDPANSNSIIFEHTIAQPIVLNATIPIKTTSLEEFATYGEAQPRIIRMSVNSYESSHIMTMNLHYRELDTNTVPRKGFLISLAPVSNVGRKYVTVSFAGSEVIPNAAANSGDLVITRINVELG